jgi:type II secretory ATPase GspE/PulE/Tfp pilus assembly ATPase PilB-like protein
METSVRVRYRLDGKLVHVDTHPKKLLPAIIARLKVMSGTMSIAEKRLPQDGRIQLKMGDKEVDLRVSSVPSNHGESIVMRILDKTALLLGLPELGFFSDDQATFEQLLGLPDGILLVTGPTGSGKTTTLYACLNVINKPDKKIITVEDPVEYELPGINQVMVKADIGMTFAAALRAMLRQAPNIIMIGEIRDAETANIAINASLTGHLVFSTLHTNDAPSAVARLADIGVKPFLIASAVRAVLAQRLVRKLCPLCKTPAELTDKEMRALSMDASRMADSSVFGPVGCDKCRSNGFRGRMGIFELFIMDDEVRQMINTGLTTSQLRRRARELGMRTLREDGIRKVLSGLTSGGEVVHATMSDAD